jgi:hypothetical protein
MSRYADGTGPGDAAGPAEARSRRLRGDGIRRVRVLSNWTAAALIAGTGAATVALAGQHVGSGPGTTTTTSVTPGTTAPGTVAGTTRPQAPSTVVTSGGSGATASVSTTQVAPGQPATGQATSGQGSGAQGG